MRIDRELNPGGGDQSREASNSKQQAGSIPRVEPRLVARPSCSACRTMPAPTALCDRVELDRKRVAPCAVSPWPQSLPSAIDGKMLVLARADPFLTFPLCISADTAEIAMAPSMWSELLAPSQLPDAKTRPAPRRRRGNVIRARRPDFQRSLKSEANSSRRDHRAQAGFFLESMMSARNARRSSSQSRQCFFSSTALPSYSHHNVDKESREQ